MITQNLIDTTAKIHPIALTQINVRLPSKRQTPPTGIRRHRNQPPGYPEQVGGPDGNQHHWPAQQSPDPPR